jgi:hypothetical protein
MPSLRNTDNSARDPKWSPTPGVHELAQVCYPRKRRENWPFRIYEENGKMYQNITSRRRKVDLNDVEDAPW